VKGRAFTLQIGFLGSYNIARERISVITGRQERIPLFKSNRATLRNFKSRIESAKQNHAPGSVFDFR
jgi:hypothetical protein